MSQDPYAPCVCGSGKKMKFCCQDIMSDMMRVEKLLENQPDAAEKLLRSLLQKHSDKEVLVTQLVSVLTRKGEYAEARDQLSQFLQNNPDEPRALLALADVCMTTEGFAASRRLVHRAFQLGARQYPDGVAMLASRIAGQMASNGCAMAVRAHLVFAIRMASADRRHHMLSQLAQFESQKSIPYPFRGTFALLDVHLDDEELAKHELRARRVSRLGCWEPASILYRRLTDQLPEHGELWYNLGLFHAWDGQLDKAIDALHRAAELIADHDTAVDAEALAQLIELETDEHSYQIVQETIPVRSLSELLTRLDEDACFARVESHDHFDEDRVAAEYEYLSRPLADPPDLDDLPDVIADLTVIDAEDDDGPRVLIVVLDDDAQKATDAFRTLAGDLAMESPDDSTTPISMMPRPCRLFDWKIHEPDQCGNSHYRDLNQRKLNTALQQWPDTPLAGLGDRTPLEAANDEGQAKKVAASVVVLDVICNRMGYAPELSEIRHRLNLPPHNTVTLSDSETVAAMPLLRMLRLNVSELNDAQLVEFTSRVLVFRHLRLMQTALDELVQRPEAVTTFTPLKAHLLRATIARENNDLEAASECFSQARAAVEDEPDAFRTRLEIDIRELSCRLDNPADPELPQLLSGIRDRYFLKIPEIEEVIHEELASSGCMHLLNQLQTAPAAAGGGEGLWTPDADNPAEGAAKKIWMPGDS